MGGWLIQSTNVNRRTAIAFCFLRTSNSRTRDTPTSVAVSIDSQLTISEGHIGYFISLRFTDLSFCPHFPKLPYLTATLIHSSRLKLWDFGLTKIGGGCFRLYGLSIYLFISLELLEVRWTLAQWNFEFFFFFWVQEILLIHLSGHVSGRRVGRT